MKQIFTCFSPSFFRKISLKFLATLAILLTLGIGSVWGEEGTLTLTRSCFTSGVLDYSTDDSWSATASTDESISGKADIFSTAAQTTLQTKSGLTPYYNTTRLPGVITKIQVDMASGTDRTYLVYASATAAITSTEGLSPIGRLTEACAVDISTAYNYRYFALQCTSGASTLNNIVITYETTPGSAIFTRVDAVKDLEDGDEIIFVNQAETYACAMRQDANNRAIKPITVSSHTYTYVPSDSVQVFTVKINASSQYGFHAGAGHLYSLSGKNQIKTNTDNLCTNPSGTTAWTLSVSSSVFSITNVSYTSYLMQFNGTTCFSQYAGTQTSPYIFKRTPTTYTVTWSAGNEPSFSTQTDVAGTALDDPGTPTASTYCPGGKVFVGWTATEDYSDDDDPPADLFTSVSGKSIPAGGTTYYAVYATRNGSAPSANAGPSFSRSNSSDTCTSGYTFAKSAGTAGTDYYPDQSTVGNTSHLSIYHTSTAIFTSTPTSIKVTAKVGGGSDNRDLTNKVYAQLLDKDGKTLGTAAVITGHITNGSGDTYSNIDIDTTGITSAYGIRLYHVKESGYNVRFMSFSLTYYTGGYTYSDYETECAPTCADPTAAGHGTINMTTQKMPITWETEADNVDICYSTSTTKPGGTPGEGYTIKSGITASTEIDSLDISGLSAGNYYTWVRSVCDESSKSNWVAITDNYFTVPGHTLTISPSPASSGSFSPTSGQTVVEKRSVSITATPAAGYTFTSWAVSGTGSTLSSTTDNPTTFTMGTADATVTATFTAKPLEGWTWKYKKGNVNSADPASVLPDVVEAYIGEYIKFIIDSYTPSDVIAAKRGYVYDTEADPKQPIYNTDSLAQVGHSTEYFTTRGKVAGTATLKLKAVGDGSIIKTMTILTKALPSVTFVDLVHNKTDFTNWGTDGVVSSTVSSGIVIHTKPTPTHNDVSAPVGGNTCETKHLHLVGWIRSDWPALVSYMNGTSGTAPDDDDIESAGYDAYGNAYYYEAGDDIDIKVQNSKTFYAIWSQME